MWRARSLLIEACGRAAKCGGVYFVCGGLRRRAGEGKREGTVWWRPDMTDMIKVCRIEIASKHKNEALNTYVKRKLTSTPSGK